LPSHDRSNGAEAAPAAGYEGNSAKVRASELHHHAVLDVLREQASKNLQYLSAVAILRLEQIVMKDGLPGR
jgi:phage terminase small subunit